MNKFLKYIIMASILLFAWLGTWLGTMYIIALASNELDNEPSVYLNVCNGHKTMCFPVVYVNSPFKRNDRCINFDDQQVYYRFCDDYSFEYGGTVEDFEKRIKEQRMK